MNVCYMLLKASFSRMRCIALFAFKLYSFIINSIMKFKFSFTSTCGGIVYFKFKIVHAKSRYEIITQLSAYPISLVEPVEDWGLERWIEFVERFSLEGSSHIPLDRLLPGSGPLAESSSLVVGV